MHAAARAVVPLVALLLAGCFEPPLGVEEVTVDRAYTAPTTRSETWGFTCDDTADLRVSLAARNGSVRVSVTDADGREAFGQRYEAPDGGTLDHALFGAEGPWVLEVDFVRYEGNLDVRVSC